MIARTAMKPAAANIARPTPPACTETFSSDFASWISFEIRVEMSRLASATSRPMVGSSPACWTSCWAMRPPSGGVSAL
jgi:hypothetical protein